jgi:uncharacterized repeat protein (TIGR01451 family)
MKKFLPLVFSTLFFLMLHHGALIAQVAALPFTPALEQYNPINGNVLTATNADDVSFNNIPIGFDFYLGGSMHDTMHIATNGFIRLGSIQPQSQSYASWFSLLSGQENNVLVPFGADLNPISPSSSLQYITTGTAPNRICIIQWSDFSYFGGQGNLNFQVHLYETSNCVKYVYGSNLFGNPLNTQIGIRGSNNLDFIALGDTACSWAYAFPFALNTTLFPISSVCSMPPGFSFRFGPCGEGANFNPAYLTGKVFHDLNGNALLDAGEPGIGSKILQSMPGNYFVSSSMNGDYAFFFSDSSLTYDIQTDPIPYWTQTTAPITVNPASQSCSGLNIGFQPIPGIHEVAVTCPSFPVRPAIPEPIGISYQNNGTMVESDTITFVMDSAYSFISANPAPDVVNGQILQWYYSNLAPGQNASIALNLLPDTNIVMGAYLNSTVSIGPLNDTMPSNNTVLVHQLITNSFDPNDKLAEPSGMIDPGILIYYTVRFQNTGNAVAYNVIVRDTLDQNLQINSFQITGSSHPMNFVMDGNGVANFIFYNIMLPDSGSDLLGSNGFVSFSIKTKVDLNPFTVINNRAGIIFDFNPPIITNTTADTIQMPLGESAVMLESYYLTVSPNPAGEQVVFNFSDNEKEFGQLSIYSIEGKVMLSKNNIRSNESIQVGALPAGVYFCRVQTSKGIATRRIVKQ